MTGVFPEYHKNWEDGALSRAFAITPNGLRQALDGQIVSNPSDRKAIARILGAVSESPMILMGVQAAAKKPGRTKFSNITMERG